MIEARLEELVEERPILHGGRLDRARRMFPGAPRPWIDLSTGVNPNAYPLPQIALESFTRLPGADALADLERIAAQTYRAGEGIHVVASAGTQALIQLLPRLWPARRVAVLAPTYEEHAASWRASGARVECVSTPDAFRGAEVAVIVNPNNPDGRLLQPDRLAAIGARMAREGRLLVVDEAFMDMLGPHHSVVPLVQGEGVVVFRSFGKAYGLPGLRLGFALCGENLAKRIRAAFGPWSVSGPALAVGAAALADKAWLRAQAQSLEQAVQRLDALLVWAGFSIVGGTRLFRLARHPQAAAWFRRLGERGILTRSFAEQPEWLRFGVPAPQAWERLARALESGHAD